MTMIDDIVTSERDLAHCVKVHANMFTVMKLCVDAEEYVRTRQCPTMYTLWDVYLGKIKMCKRKKRVTVAFLKDVK